MIEDGSPVQRRRRLIHPVTGDVEGGTTLLQARLTDRQRLAVVLEGAALLGHLEASGNFLAKGWRRAQLTPQGRLAVHPVQPGRARELVQVQLVYLLLSLFQSESEIAGRGEARRAARRLLQSWRQTLTPVSAEDAIVDIMEQAPFLWQEGFAASRSTLVGVIERADGERRLSLVAPRQVSARLLRLGAELKDVQGALGSPQARQLWEGEWDEDPMALAAAGHWERAVAAWRRSPPSGAQAALALGRCLVAVGRYRRALEVLARHQRFEALLLRLWCQTYLGEIDAAFKTLRRAEAKDLSAEQLLRLGEVAIRILAARRQDDAIGDWVARCRTAAKGSLKPQAALLAAAASWDREDWSAMRRHLDEAEPARQDESLAGRWHHLSGLWARASGDSLRAVEHLGQALKLQRRRLAPVEAGRLWNDMAIVRASAGDLAGAERACRHAVRLLRHSEGPGRTTLALYNLAEVRIRRGRFAGVETILEASTAANRRSKNERGLVHDLELWVRFELAQGRSTAALARCSEAMRHCSDDAIGDRRQVFDLFSARAYGWLGRVEEARSCLERVDPQQLWELDEEERPAVLALGGCTDEAKRVACEGPWAELWGALLESEHPPPSLWRSSRRLEPFRAARLVFDGELILPGSVPPSEVRRAIAVLRDCGADSMAERLEYRSLSPWLALDAFLEVSAPDWADAAQLLDASGYGGARLSLLQGGRETVLLAGNEQGEELETPCGPGVLRLQVGSADPTAGAFLRLLGRLMRPRLSGAEVECETLPRVATGGMIGESPALRDAIQRIERLATGRLPMLILGESGTGKELAARLAHHRSRRREGPFLAVNCAALSESLIQSDLFGHVRGAFTGADRDRAGIFESAKDGTVFLDEIGDLPLAAQGKLLRVLQENEVRRVGESFTRKVDARVVAATHRDLEAMVSAGEFRQDLFFRLKVATVLLPPLRERGRDIVLLAEHFIELQRRHLPHLHLSAEAKRRLQTHDWPGNVRELTNVLEVAAALSDGGEIAAEHLELPECRPIRQGDYHLRVENLRRQLVAGALDKSGGNRAEAARILGLSRQALSYLVKQLGLS